MRQNDNRKAIGGAGDLMKGWMAAFAYQYERFRRKCPNQPLLVVFDIDGTIVDVRYAAMDAMRRFDRQQGASVFSETRVEDIQSLAGQIDWDDTRSPLAPANDPHFREYYDRCSRESEAILASHEPHRGVLDFMRWLQLQPAVQIAVNTARSEAQRDDTMHVLDVLGRAFGVRFHPHLIQMRSSHEANIQVAKLAGLHRFIRDGFRVIAIADSQRENIAAIHRFAGFWDETLYLESLAPRAIKHAQGDDEMQSDVVYRRTPRPTCEPISQVVKLNSSAQSYR